MSEPKKPRGEHRIKNPDPLEDGVWVTDDTQGFEVKESDYLRNGYEPPLKDISKWGKSRPGG